MASLFETCCSFLVVLILKFKFERFDQSLDDLDGTRCGFETREIKRVLSAIFELCRPLAHDTVGVSSLGREGDCPDNVRY